MEEGPLLVDTIVDIIVDTLVDTTIVEKIGIKQWDSE